MNDDKPRVEVLTLPRGYSLHLVVFGPRGHRNGGLRRWHQPSLLGAPTRPVVDLGYTFDCAGGAQRARREFWRTAEPRLLP